MPQLVLPVPSTCAVLDTSLEVINAHQFGFCCDPTILARFNQAWLAAINEIISLDGIICP